MTDFGSAKIRDKLEQNQIIMSGNIGTPSYMPPELLSDKETIKSNGYALDVYSFGVMMHSVLSREQPYSDDKHSNMNVWILRDKIIAGSRPSMDPGIRACTQTKHTNQTASLTLLLCYSPVQCAPFSAISLMTRCWDNDPKNRPGSFREICIDLRECTVPSSLCV